MNRKIAVFPGSFDPVTKGHEDIIKRSLLLFDEIIVAIGENTGKAPYFEMEKRLAFIKEIFAAETRVKVTSFKGLTMDFCAKNNVRFIIRGLRSSADFTYENPIAQANKKIGNIETVFLSTSPEYSFISSSIIRDILSNNGDATSLLPDGKTSILTQK